MEFKDFTAGKDDSDRRLDRVLRIFLSNKGLPEIYKLLRKGLIKLNHKKAKPETHIVEGDIISIASFLFDDDKTEDLEKSEKTKPEASTSTNRMLWPTAASPALWLRNMWKTVQKSGKMLQTPSH